MRAVIYARHSTDKQSESSSNDQIAACIKYIRQKGWHYVTSYKDEAISGASKINRPGFLSLTEASRNRDFDIVLVEDVDRLGRRVSDVMAFNDILEYNKQELHTLYNGKIDSILLGVKATLDQAERKKIAEKTRRGMKAKAERGQIASGLSYGYDIDKTTKSGRSINQAQALIINRVFDEYGAGKTPEDIVRGLNLDHISGPSKDGYWLNTTIRGQGKRATGILNNQLYIGKYVFNKTAYSKNPETACREANINEASEHIEVHIPQLRIITDEIWHKVKARQQSLANTANQKGVKNKLSATNRNKYILTNLLKCSHCGGSYTMYGKNHLRCNNYKRGTSLCLNSKSVKRIAMEERVLSTLKSHLITPELIKIFIEEYSTEMQRLQKEGTFSADKIHRQLNELTQAKDNLITAIETGTIPLELIAPKLNDKENQIQSLQNKLDAIHANQEYFSVDSDLSERFTELVRDLQSNLEQEPVRREAVELIQSLMSKVVVIPDEEAEDGVLLEVHGDLAQILTLSQLARGSQETECKKLPATFVTESQLAVVAGARFELTTFRL